jgi:transposase
MKSKRTPESIDLAKSMYAQGQSHKSISEHFGISQSTVRLWIDDEYRQQRLDAAIQRQRNFTPEQRAKMNAYQAQRLRNRSREEKDKACERQRRRYIRDDRYKETLRRLMHKHQRTAQGRLSFKLRLAHLGHTNRFPSVYRPMMEAITGLTREQYTALFQSDGQSDHIIPLCAFDLTNPHHLVRAAHQSNLQILPVRSNQIKGKSIPPNLDIMSMRWSNNQLALDLAITFISSQLAKLDKLNAKDPVQNQAEEKFSKTTAG